jgi:hypothetical protein
MSYPMAETCFYCGSPDVMDDAWWCEAPECWDAYYREEQERADYEARTPLTRSKALSDLWSTDATVWGPMARYIELMACQIATLAKAPVR